MNFVLYTNWQKGHTSGQYCNVNKKGHTSGQYCKQKGQWKNVQFIWGTELQTRAKKGYSYNSLNMFCTMFESFSSALQAYGKGY